MEEYRKEEKLKEKTEMDKENELIRSIIQTKNELNYDNINFEYAELDLVDYYIYHIRANQAKMNYLLKLAKARGICIVNITQIRYESFTEEIG